MSTPAKTFEEVRGPHERDHEGPRWVPIAAAVLAVFAAISSYAGNVRSTTALIAKNDAIVAITHASDTYAEFQADRLKFYVAQTALDAGVGPGGDAVKLREAATREAGKAKPLLAKAKGFEDEAKRANARSERSLAQHETIEVATTLFEVSIVLVSITALVGSRLLPIVAGVASALGIVIFAIGLVR